MLYKTIFCYVQQYFVIYNNMSDIRSQFTKLTSETYSGIFLGGWFHTVSKDERRSWNTCNSKLIINRLVTQLVGFNNKLHLTNCLGDCRFFWYF